MIDPATTTMSSFEARQGDSFRTGAAHGELELVLEEVSAKGTSDREGGAFSLVFVGPPDQPIGQGIAQLTHGDGKLSLFLVPIGPFGDGLGYEAIFN